MKLLCAFNAMAVPILALSSAMFVNCAVTGKTGTAVVLFLIAAAALLMIVLRGKPPDEFANRGKLSVLYAFGAFVCFFNFVMFFEMPNAWILKCLLLAFSGIFFVVSAVKDSYWHQQFHC